MNKNFSLFLTLLASLPIGFTPLNANAKSVRTNYPSEQTDNTELISRYEKGLEALNKEDYLRARSLFQALARDFYSDFQGHEELYFSTMLNLAISESNLNNFVEADHLLNRLSKQNPTPEVRIAIETFRARISQQQNNPQEAFLRLHNLEKMVALKDWEKQEQDYYLELKNELNEHYFTVIANAERMEKNGQYDLAKEHLLTVLDAISKGHFPQELDEPKRKDPILLKLAHCYYQLQEDQAVINTIKVLGEQAQQNEEVLFLKALSHQRLNQMNEASKAFLNFLEKADETQAQKIAQANLELGIIYYHQKKPQLAKKYLDLAASQSPVASIYLGRMLLADANYKALDTLLKKLKPQVRMDSPLYYELAYLQGESLFQQKAFYKAITAYEQAIPRKNKEQAHWYSTTLYNLAWCYLKMSKDEKTPAITQTQLLAKAETILTELIAFNKTPDASLLLARIYLSDEKRLNDPDSFKKLSELLGKVSFKDPLDEAEAIYLQAIAAPEDKEKLKLYQKLSVDTFQNSPYYGLAWFFQASHFFEQANQLREDKQEQAAKDLYQKSVHLFTKSFKFLKENDLRKAALSVQYSIYAQYYLGSEESLHQGFSLSQKLFKNTELIEALESKDELLFIGALIAAELFEKKPNHVLSQTLDKITQQIVSQYPNSAYADQVLFLNAYMHYQSKEYDQAEKKFFQLVSNYSQSPLMPKALHWLAEVAEWQGREPSVIQDYRKRIFTLYPNLPIAQEAYFNYYSFSDYLQGAPEALSHLEHLQELFPKSPYNIVSQYLLGLSYKQDQLDVDGKLSRPRDLAKAGSFFNGARNLFAQYYNTDKIDTDQRAYYTDIYYRSLFELPSVKRLQAEGADAIDKRILFEQSLSLYQELSDELENPESLYRKTLGNNPLQNLYEDTLYHIATIQQSLEKFDEAEKQFNKILHYYAKAEKKTDFYLARSWYYLGVIAMQKQDPKLALNYFDKAAIATDTRIFSTDQRLDLWIQTSQAQQSLGQFDAAMLMLSKVINDPNASELSTQAMFLRALIYEKQGKRHFALKQLESTSKKSGIWAEKAQEKLRQNYVFN